MLIVKNNINYYLYYQYGQSKHKNKLIGLITKIKQNANYDYKHSIYNF